MLENTTFFLSADESFSESMRRGIEAQVALLTNGNGRHAATNGALSDDDTLADTASVSTLDDDVPHKEKQKVIFSVVIEMFWNWLNMTILL